MAYDQAAANWQADAERWQARAEQAEAVLAALRIAGVPTTPEHEAEHRRMDAEFSQAAPGPEPGERWRTGTSPGTDGLTLYRHTPDGPDRGELVGMMRDRGDAALVVDAVNRELERPAAGRCSALGMPPYPQIMAVCRDADALLAGRNAGRPELIAQELRRMRAELDQALEVVREVPGADT